jgi:dihydroorotase
MPKILIENGRIIDPANSIDQVGSVYISDGKILPIKQVTDFVPDVVINAENKIVCPGFIDLSVRLRDPGQSYKGTVQSETYAAACAGVTTLCLPPDTSPVIDTEAVVELIIEKAEKANYNQVLPIGALTQGLKGKELGSMAALKQAGCLAVSNATRPLDNLLVIRRAMEYASSHDLLVICQPEVSSLSKNGCVHEGIVATRFGILGIPDVAESIAVAQWLELAEHTGCRLHFTQISSRRAVIKIQQAQKYGLKVTADVAIHQLHLTEESVETFNSVYHLRPPLRTEKDKKELREGLNKTISAICSAHQPHDLDAKLAAFPETEPGISSLETLLPLLLRLVEKNVVTLSEGIATLTKNPASILKINRGALTAGFSADICIFDPALQWDVNQKNWNSAGCNTPYWGETLVGRVTHTIQTGKIIYSL